MKHANVLIIVLSVLIPALGAAKVPPLSPKALDARASHIVEGTVRAPFKIGKVAHDRCYGWQKMSALVDVTKQHKGSAAKVVVLQYATRVEDTKGCTGGRTSYRFAKGQRYKLHLKCSWPKTKKGTKVKARPICYPINWAGVKRIK